MSSNSFRALVLFGSGPGIGRHVASRFAEGHFQHIILLSRDQRRLEEDASIVRSAGPGASVDIVPCDLSQLQSVRKALDSVAQKLQERGTHLEVVCFNAARVAKTQLLATPPEEMDTDFKITNTALLAVAQWAIPRFQHTFQTKPFEQFKPTLLVTGGLLHREPITTLFSLSAVKAAQYNLVASLYKAYAKQGIHVAMVLVGGFVAADSKNCNPLNIANAMWELYSQDSAHWTKEIELLDPDWEESSKG